MNTSEKKRRFIAGAICPRCSELDKLVVYREQGEDFRACVSCDFKEKMHFQPSVSEMDTRVNVTPEKIAAQTQVVKLIDPNM